MLTLFSFPKPFQGHINIIQRNAIKSWILLQPRPEIILLGNEEGTADIAREFGLCHIPEVERNEYGTPLVNSVFSTGEAYARYPFICYVNADIILMSDFMRAIRFIETLRSKFLMVGRRWDIDLNQAWDFEKPGWEEELKFYTLNYGTLHPPTGIDYFVFPKGLFSEVLPFALGRTVWDNWLIYYARSHRIPVIDLTKVVMAIHQNHSYPDSLGGKSGIWKGEEAKRNLELAGGLSHTFTISNATHRLTPKGCRKRLLYLWIEPFISPAKKLIEISQPIRRRLGLVNISKKVKGKMDEPV